jgi:hypothetical protein
MSKQNLDRLNFLILGGMDFDWSAHLAEQLSWHWEAQLRPRLAGLTDDEYFWEPAPDAPFADLVLHIHREAIHHGAEVSLLRDLYLHQ